MNQPQILWDLEDDPDGNVQHLLLHDVEVDEAEEVLLSRSSEMTRSRTSGERITFGLTSGGRYLAVVWEHVMEDPLTIRPITAYEVSPPRPPRKRRNRK